MFTTGTPLPAAPTLVPGALTTMPSAWASSGCQNSALARINASPRLGRPKNASRGFSAAEGWRFALAHHCRAFQRMGKRHAGADVFAPGEQLQGVARDPTVYVVVVATVADHTLVVADAGAVFGKGRTQPIERHRARPAHVVAPVAAAVAAQLLVLEAAHRG